MESFMEEMVMNRFEYLGALNNCIQHELPADEYNNVMQYYSEYFADAGIEKEQEVIQELGAPSELARRIIAEYRGRQPGEVFGGTLHNLQLGFCGRREAFIFQSDGLFL